MIKHFVEGLRDIHLYSRDILNMFFTVMNAFCVSWLIVKMFYQIDRLFFLHKTNLIYSVCTATNRKKKSTASKLRVWQLFKVQTR